MITRFDHVVLAVRDLTSASAAFEALAATREWLEQHGFETRSAWPNGLRVSPRHAVGAELGFVA